MFTYRTGTTIFEPCPGHRLMEMPQRMSSFFGIGFTFLLEIWKKKHTNWWLEYVSPTQTDEWDMWQKHKLMIGICFTNTNWWMGYVSVTQTDEWNCFTNTNWWMGYVSVTQTDEWNCFTNNNWWMELFHQHKLMNGICFSNTNWWMDMFQ